MALIITQQDYTIILEGTLNAATVKNFKTHFGFVQNPFNSLTLNIDKLTNIDVSAMIELKFMYEKAIQNNNIFFVEGIRSEEIYESFQYPQLA